MATDTADSNHKQQETRAANAGQYLQFRIAGLLLCVPLCDVERVLPMVEWQPVPGGAAFLCGLLNLHGTAVPIIDLATRLGHRGPQNYTLDTPILLVHAGDRSAGLVVRDILGIIDPGTRDDRLRQQFNAGDLPFEAAFDTADGLTMLVNIERVLDFRLDDDADDLAEAAAQQLQALG